VTAQPSPACTLAVGAVRVTFIPDGSIHVPPVPMFAGGTPDLFDARPHLLDGDGYLVMSLGAVLVETARRRILIDLGWGPSTLDMSKLNAGTRRGRIIGGRLLDGLARQGLTTDDIDVVVFSHLHADHIGWLTTEGGPGHRLTFRRAAHRLSEPEWTYWSERAGEERWGGPSAVQLEALLTQLDPLEDGETLAEGLNVLLTPGHTPGHASFVVSSGTERAIVLGDTIHCPLEISHPELALLSDVDPVAGRAVRDRLRTELEAGAIAVGGHFSDLAFGRVIKGRSRRWLEPLDTVQRI
jgi:glyoxylase-like metal-dependent hydrolase (beta-lactamase superfamily II)